MTLNKIKDFIRSNIETYIWTIIFLIATYAVFFVTNTSTEVFTLILKVVLGLIIIYNIMSFISYKQRENLKSKCKDLELEKKTIQSEFAKYKTDTKEYFIMLVHQMKTPITASKLLIDEESAQNEELSRQLLYLEDYVNMTLAFLKIIDTNTDMDICNVSLDDVLKNELKKYSMIFISKGIKLDYIPTGKIVTSDFRWLSLLIEQLLSNALKYTKNGYIKIYFEGNSLHIEDSGIGIKKEDINKIFDMGYSGFNGRLNQKSSGLGLYLAKKISIKLGIDISVTSEPNKGSTFTLNFNKL